MAGPLRSCSSVTSCINGWSSWNELKVLGGMFCPVTMSIAEASCSLGLSYTEGGIEKYDNYSLRSSVTILYTLLCMLLLWKLPLFELLASPVYHHHIQTSLDGCIWFSLIGINLCSSSKQLPACIWCHPFKNTIQDIVNCSATNSDTHTPPNCLNTLYIKAIVIISTMTWFHQKQVLSFQPGSASDVTVTIVLGLFACHMIHDLCSISHTTRTIWCIYQSPMLQYTKWHAENDIHTHTHDIHIQIAS